MSGSLSPPPECLPARDGRQGALSSLGWDAHGAAPRAEERGLDSLEDWGPARALALPLRGCPTISEPRSLLLSSGNDRPQPADLTQWALLERALSASNTDVHAQRAPMPEPALRAAAGAESSSQGRWRRTAFCCAPPCQARLSVPCTLTATLEDKRYAHPKFIEEKSWRNVPKATQGPQTKLAGLQSSSASPRTSGRWPPFHKPAL